MSIFPTFRPALVKYIWEKLYSGNCQGKDLHNVYVNMKETFPVDCTVSEN